MIKINLLPEEIKTKALGVKAIFNLGAKYLMLIIPVVAGLLVLAHICLAVLGVVRAGQFAELNKKWEVLASQRKALEDFSKEHAVVTEDTKFLQQAFKQRLNWAEKLNKLSSGLPSGVWFKEITISSKALVIIGSVVSLQKQEMALIRKFIDNLKNDTGFFKDFVSLELGTVQTRPIADYNIFDFVLTGTLTAK